MSRIYISSTFVDLKPFRDAVYKALRRLEWEVGGVEDYFAADERPLQRCLEEIDRADVFVGIIAHRYGYVPPSEQNSEHLSITELEFDRASERRVPRLMYLLDEDTPWPPKWIDHSDRLVAFKERVKAEVRVGSFSTPDNLATSVITAIPSKSVNEAARLVRRQYEVEFEAFLSYNVRDRVVVQEIAERLNRDGIRVWMDVTALRAGDRWQQETERALLSAAMLVVFVGPAGIGTWQHEEISAAVHRKQSEGNRFRVIPVILPGTEHGQVPAELANYVWVDISSLDPSEAYAALKNAIRPATAAGRPAKRPQRLDEQDLKMLSELLFRLIVRRRDDEEMLRRPDAAAFWGAVRKVRPDASDIEDLRSLHAELSGVPGPGPLWSAWVRNAFATELAALIEHSDLTQPAS